MNTRTKVQTNVKKTHCICFTVNPLSFVWPTIWPDAFYNLILVGEDVNYKMCDTITTQVVLPVLQRFILLEAREKLRQR